MTARWSRRTVLGGLAAFPAAGVPAAPADGRAILGTAGVAIEAGGTMRFAADPTGSAHDYRWHIGSNTKAMTAFVYARLVEAGRCDWGAPLPDLFPGMAIHPAWSATTVEQVMAHVAGISDAMIDPAWLTARHTDTRPVPVQRHAFVADLLSRPPQAGTGKFLYSNADYILLGATIERITGRAWEDVIQFLLFRPLGIRSAGQGPPPRDGPWGHRGVEAIDPAGIADNPPIFGPAGRVHLDPADYARFLALFLHDGGRLLKPETMAHLLTPPTPEGRYAGGWALLGVPGRDSRWIGHDGSNTLWYARAEIRRDTGLASAAFTNVGGAAGLANIRSMMARLETHA